MLKNDNKSKKILGLFQAICNAIVKREAFNRQLFRVTIKFTHGFGAIKNFHKPAFDEKGGKSLRKT